MKKLVFEPLTRRFSMEELTDEKIQEIEDHIHSWDGTELEAPIKPRGWLTQMVKSARYGNGEDAVRFYSDGTLYVNDCWELCGIEIEISPDGCLKMLAIS